ncbi:methylcytosine dioxygenase TET1 isoform X1 [Microtus oregoni]|uniref:methylcytosine dioxygenase TET1 isoform X1 n=1 Tax=Microtus oregoni TaxID=111838 RepID=UPI001BB10EFF|nr:methylcytosine dioxygenase TET1 isoform X1 [Microtus oregoni]
MSRSRHAKPSKAVRTGLQKKKTTLKQGVKHGESGKLNPGKLNQVTQRDGKKEPEDKSPTPPRSLLTRAGAARMNQDRIQVESPESLAASGFTMALRRSSLIRRLSQSPVVTPRPKKVSPAKSVSKQQCPHETQDDAVAEHSENDCIPSQDPTSSPDPENLIGEESLCLVEGEIQELTQSWPQTIEGSQSCPATDIPSGPLEGTHNEGLLALHTSDVSTSPQECVPLSQRSTPEVTSQKNTSNQFEDLGSQVNSLKLSDPPLNPVGNESNCFPTSSFKILPELDLKNCLSLDGSVYPTALIRFLLAGSQPDTLDMLGAKPQEGTLKTNPDQGGCYPYQFLDGISALGQVFSALPPQWVFPGANLVPGEALGKVSGLSEDLGAITMLTQQGTMNMNMAAPPDLPVFLPNPIVPLATYSTPPGPEPHSFASCGLEVQGAIPLTLDSGHAPANSEISSIPPAIAATSVQDEKQFCANPSPANRQGFTIDPESGLQRAPLDLTQGPQATSSKVEGGISQVNTASSADGKATGISMPVSQASTSSSQKSTLPMVERKKRKPCGVCEPCQQKTNCGECTYCMNRRNSHQICKKRKCEVLKKKPDATSLVQVTKENKRPQREKKPKVLKRDNNNKPVNGPKSESMEDSQCGHGEEQRLDLNSQPLENVGKNAESMTGIEVENWTPNKKSSRESQVKGDLDTNLTEVGKPQSSEDDKQQSQPSPMFPQAMRNGMKNVYCLPTDTNLPINKLDLEEISKVLGNSSSKLLPGPSNGKDAMNSVASDRSCDHLKGSSDTLFFQKPGLNCQSAAASTIPKDRPKTHSSGCQPQSPEKIPSKDPKDDSPVQPSLLSLMKDRRLTLEQVVAIEALTQLSEAPSENSSPSKPEKGEETDQRTASLLDNCKAILNSVREDLQDTNIKCLQHQNTEFKLPDSSATNQTLEDSDSLTAGDKPTLDSSKNLYPLPVESHNPEDCSQALNGDQKLNSQYEPPCQDVPYSQIEEDVAAQLTQLASTINYNHINPDVKNAGSTPGSLAAKNTQQKPSQEKGMAQEKPASSIQNKPSVPPAKPKNKTQKKAKQTPKTDKRKKEPPLPSSQENDQKQEQLATQYSNMHDIWISSKFQRFGQSGPHSVPNMFGNPAIFSQKLKPIAQNNIPLQPYMTFLPLRQIKFTRQSELAKENVKVEPPDALPTCQIKTESSGQAIAEPVDNSQVQSSVNSSEKAHPLPQPSPQSNQCANMMPGAAQTQLQLGAQENLVHPIPPTLPGTSPESPLPDPASILRKGNVSGSNGMAGVNAKPEAQAPSHGPRSDSATHSVQMEFFEHIKKYLRDPAKFLQPEVNETEEPTCDCNDGGTQKDKGPYYTHLGAGPSVAAVRELMETRYGHKGKAVRIEKVEYTGKEGKSSQGCPVAKCILRRSGSEEKILCLARVRPGHFCATTVMVVVIMIWEAIPRPMADYLYEELTINLRSYSGHPTDRRCTLNENRTCTCQGLNPKTCGASFSFGCSWSMFLNGCKFGRSPNPRKFRLAPNYPLNSYYRRITGSRRFSRRRRMRPVKPRQMFPEHRAQEKKLEELFQKLADDLAPIYKQMAPVAYQNQVKYEDVAGDCRLGTKKGRPFSGVTCCLDFCAHSHRDIHNMINGSTVVCTLLRKDVRDKNNPEDEQLHVLPLHRLADTDEFGSQEGMEEKIRSGAIEIVQPSRKKQLRFNEPIPRCGKRRTTMPHFIFKGSDNTKSFSSASSTHHPVNEEAGTCTYNNTASGGFPETSSGVPCTMPSGANVAAGAGTEQPGEAAALPQPSLPIADTPLSSPSEQLPFLNCAHEPDSCQVEDGQHSEAEEPLSDGALSDDQSSEDDEPEIQEYWSDNELIFLNPSYGGVAIAPIHGSVMIECARRELHATTPVENANRNDPLRMSLVFYQHKGLILPSHGFYFNRIKFESKIFKKKAAERKGPDKSSFVANLLCNIPSRIAPTLTRDNVVTVSPYALTHVAGPYNHWI